MSIGKRVSKALDAFDAGDLDEGLIAISIAVDATASQIYPGAYNNVAYKQFIHDEMTIITYAAYGVRILNVKFEYSHSDLKPDADGLCSLQQILYHVVRCCLLHRAELPQTLRFTQDADEILGRSDGVVELPGEIILGLAIAVVSAPCNSGERVPKERWLKSNGKLLRLNDLWGKKQKYLDLIK